MLKLFLWLRYLGKKRVALLSMAAVALSTALLIVVASLFNGFIGAYERSAEDAIGDVVISADKNIAYYPELIGQLEELSPVEAATGILTTQGLLHLGRGNVRAAEIWGIEVQKRGRVTSFGRSLLKTEDRRQKTEDGIWKTDDGRQKTEDQEIEGYIGIGLTGEPNEITDEYDIQKAKAVIGSEVVITTGTAVEEKEGVGKFRRRAIEVNIAEIVFTGIYYLDSRIVYLPIERLQKAIYPDINEPIARQIQIKLKKGADAESAIAQIRGAWKAFASGRLGWDETAIELTVIETARQMQARYVAEVRKQMGILLLIFGVVSMSAVLLVFCILYMIVESRRRDVAILKSCGAGSVTVAAIFAGFGGCVGAIGAAVGTGLGYLITKNINTFEEWIRIIFGLKLWKASVYMFSRIPNEVDWSAVVWIVISAIAGAAIGAAVPAISAVMTRPVNVLRYE